ncbi:hypothetical protein PSH79_08765 [Pseudomonas sp. FP2196]|uniref:hypothetical protein n=1 Tax=Pseudomonas sp. FP2196 TaxID=2954086 RepID=UPI002734C45B|nr:hypothetical protein [Pseudomonas sp. FP2196]WLH37380.1 hypothetical protein PSH79_08765 [Pseudomonas sp. FP2196]
MTKPPKTVSGSHSSDTSQISRPVQDNIVADRFNIDTPTPLMSGGDRVSDTSTLSIAGNDDIASRIVVTRITDPVMTDLNTNLREISWPALQNHLLQPHESIDGFHLSPKGELYAHLEEGGYYRAELNTNGDYQIPWPTAPGVTPPILRKIEGQSRWRVEADWYSRISAQGNRTQPALTSAPSQASVILPPNLAALLTSAHSTADGLRYDKHKKSYVDLPEGTVMVRKNAFGHYQETFAGERMPSGSVVEPIPGTHLWRRKAADTVLPADRRPAPDTDEATAETSKRQRMDGEPDADDALVREWRDWGNTTKPLFIDSIEIEGKHFPIVPQAGHADDALAFIKPPRFAAEHFDAFEHMLVSMPELQPRGVVKIRQDHVGAPEPGWKVLDGYPFKKPLAKYVADTFPYMSEHSANETARLMFNRANHSEEMNGYGLHDLFDTLHQWTERSRRVVVQNATRQDLIDPLALMPPLPKDATGYMYMPPLSAGGLNRIDFDSQRLPVQWKRAINGSSPRAVFKAVLEHQGYDIFESFRQTQRDALMFRRTGVDSLFLMLFSPFHEGRIYRGNPTDWVYSKALKNQINPNDALILRKHVEKNKIFYFLGSFNILSSGQGSLVITKFD